MQICTQIKEKKFVYHFKMEKVENIKNKQSKCNKEEENIGKN